MCEPFKHGGTIRGISCEAISASSSLHMCASPIEGPHREGAYLSETDEWAKHSIEHLHAVCDEARQADEKLAHLQCMLYALSKQLNAFDAFEPVLDLLRDIRG